MSHPHTAIMYADPAVLSAAERDVLIMDLQAALIAVADRAADAEPERIALRMKFGLSEKESFCLSVLMRRAVVPSEVLGGIHSTVQEPEFLREIGRAMVLRLRRKLAAKGLADVINTVVGEGYHIRPVDIRRLRACLSVAVEGEML